MSGSSAIWRSAVRFANRRFLKTLNSYGIFGKFFWIAILCVSLWNIVSIFLLMFNRFLTDSVGISLETDYLHWSNTFPAISICLAKGKINSDVLKFFDMQNVTVQTEIRGNYLDQLFSDLRGVSIRTCKEPKTTCGIDLELLEKLRAYLLPDSCAMIMENVTYLGRLVENCENIFKFHKLTMGACFLANNIMDYGTRSKLPLKYDVSNEERTLGFALRKTETWKYQMYVHSPEEMPYYGSTNIQINDNRLYSYKINEIVNAADVVDETVVQRNCKFPNEFLKDSIYHYSFSTCSTDFKIQTQLKKYNCTINTAPLKYQKYYCDIETSKAIKTASDEWFVEEIGYTCYPSCLEQQISLIGTYGSNRPTIDGYAIIDIELPNIPTIRYKRIVKQTYLDLVVSVGGVIGLFIGASLMNVVEIFFSY